VPSSLLSGQLPYPRNLYTSWVEQAAHVPRVCSCSNPASQRSTSLAICLPAISRFCPESGLNGARKVTESALEHLARKTIRTTKMWWLSAQERSEHLRCSPQASDQRSPHTMHTNGGEQVQTKVHLEKANMYKNCLPALVSCCANCDCM